MKMRLLLFLFCPLLAAAQWSTEYWPNGQKRGEGWKREGLQDSTWNYWYESGNISAVINYKRGVINGKYIYYYGNRNKMQEGVQIDGVSRDSFINYYPTGKMKDLTIMDTMGIKNGPYREWYDTDTLRLKACYKNNLFEGDYVFYYDNGKPAYKKQYIRGAENGETVYWDKGGNMLWKSVFKDGMRNGLCTAWYPNGKKEFEGTYVNDLMQGKWKYWDKTGKSVKTETYEKGKLINTVNHDN